MQSSAQKKKQQQFIEKAIKLYTNTYDYSKVEYINVLTKVTIICPVHKEFQQTPQEHLRGGCKQCSYANLSKRYQHTTQQFIEKATNLHGTRYDYSKVEYVDNKTKTIIICPVHGEFLQTPSAHLSKSGCKQCSIDKITWSAQQFIDKAIEIHGMKYDYSKVVYINALTKVTIICPVHGEFKQVPSSHIRKVGCQNCKYKTEMKLFEYLQTNYPDVQSQKTFEWLVYKKKQRLDFYLGQSNIAIELQGRQHFVNVECFGNTLDQVQQLDLNKERLLQQHNISIIYIFQEDVYNDKFEWQIQLVNAINFIQNNQSNWQKICIGSVYK